jgi:hypothetical protein
MAQGDITALLLRPDMNRSKLVRAWATVFVAAVLLMLPSQPAAHEIPARVTVNVFVKPEAQRLRLLVRVPLEAMRDVKFPLYGPGYLDLARADSTLTDAAKLWLANSIEIYENGRRLPTPNVTAVRATLPSDRSFDTFENALANVASPRLPNETDLVWQQAMLDVLLDYTITAEQSEFSIRPALANLGIRTVTVLRFLPPGGSERAFEYVGDPGVVRLDPRWHQAALGFVKLGFFHILDGIDHLLFVLCLVIPFRKFRPLLVIVTSFTIAHSITLIASAAGLAPSALWFPPLIEVLIALSILYMAFENMVGAKVERRWLIAFAFGLVHGFGFSFALRESLQFAGSHVTTSLLAFNVGVELGQIFVLLLAIPVLELLFRKVVTERVGTFILSALVAHTAWHWMTERGSALRQYQFEWPAADTALLTALMRYLMLALIVGGVVWGLYGLAGRFLGIARQQDFRP